MFHNLDQGNELLKNLPLFSTIFRIEAQKSIFCKGFSFQFEMLEILKTTL